MDTKVKIFSRFKSWANCCKRLPVPRCALSRWASMLSLVLLLQVCESTETSVQLCAGAGNRLVCDRHNPAVYHVCSGTNQYAMVCPGSLHFNEKTQICDWPEATNCVQEAISRAVHTNSMPGQSEGGEYIISLPTKTEHTRFIVSPTPSNRLEAISPDLSFLKSEVSALEADNPDTSGSSPRLKVAHEMDDEDLIQADEKVIYDASTVDERLDVLENHLDRLHSGQASHKVEPYIALFHRQPFSTASQKKSTALTTQSLSPYWRLASGHGRSKPASKYLRSQVSDLTTESSWIINSTYIPRKKWYRGYMVSETPNWYQTHASGEMSSQDEGHFTQKETKTPLNKNVSPYKSKWQDNKTYRLYNEHSPQHQPSTDDTKRFKLLPRGRIKIFKHQTIQQKYLPKELPANTVVNSSLELQDLTKLKINKYKPFQETINTLTSNVVKKHAVQDKKFGWASPQSSIRPENAKKILSFSHAGQSWRSLSASTPHDTKPSASTANPSTQNLSDWHKPVLEVDTMDPSISDEVVNRIIQKLSSRPKARKYKPRHHVAIPNQHNNKPSPKRIKNPARERSTSYMSRLRQKGQSPNATTSLDKNLPGQNKTTSTGTSRGRLVNAAAASGRSVSSKVKLAAEKHYIQRTGKCSSSWCKLPACRCVGVDVPAGLKVKEVPQMVMLTFDDSITSQAMTFYRDLFNGSFRNPNGCPIRSTFFVSGDNTNFELVRRLYKQGHEVASHTLTHKSPTTWWAGAGVDNWENEVVGMRERLVEKSGVPRQLITGMRAPFLQIGGDGQYAMLTKNNFRYDSSMVTGHPHANKQPPIWPFTLDTPPDSATCNIGPCPTRSYPGLWEVPLVRWYGSNKVACAMPDACTADPGSRGQWKMIDENFQRHYSTNRAPFGIFIHASWFSRTVGSFEGLKQFLTKLSNMEDVWLVTLNQVLDWVQRPVRLSNLNSLESWSC